MKFITHNHTARFKRVLIVALGLLVAAHSLLAQSQQATLQPINLSYTIKLVSSKYGNATLGKVETELSRSETGFQVASATKAQGIAAILMGSNRQEACDFSIEQGRAVSHTYSGGRKDLEDYQVRFDWQNRKIEFDDGASLDMPQGYVVDNCNLLFATALLGDVEQLSDSLYIVDGNKKRIRGYRMKSSNEELLETDFGEFSTRKIVFERELKPERTLTFWLAPDYSYVPLKMVERRNKRTTTFLVDKIEG